MKLSDIKPAHAEAFARFVKFCEENEVSSEIEVRDEQGDLLECVDGAITLTTLKAHVQPLCEGFVESLDCEDTPYLMRHLADYLECLKCENFAVEQYDMTENALCMIK